ncbi:MAG: hypothetical protein Q8M07_02625 [Prosthecobacter sp.]|nr:hypothetical protein [Prosthecobacter sp.]
MLLEIPADVRIADLHDFARRTGHALREAGGKYVMIPVPPVDNIVQPPALPIHPTIAEVAKALDIHIHTLYARLRILDAITGDNRPRPEMVERKLMFVSTRSRTNPLTQQTTPYQVTVVTEAGVEWIKQLLARQDQAAS